MHMHLHRVLEVALLTRMHSRIAEDRHAQPEAKLCVMRYNDPRDDQGATTLTITLQSSMTSALSSIEPRNSDRKVCSADIADYISYTISTRSLVMNTMLSCEPAMTSCMTSMRLRSRSYAYAST